METHEQAVRECSHGRAGTHDALGGTLEQEPEEKRRCIEIITTLWTDALDTHVEETAQNILVNNAN